MIERHSSSIIEANYLRAFLTIKREKVLNLPNRLKVRMSLRKMVVR
jgi:hypothetical protein